MSMLRFALESTHDEYGLEKSHRLPFDGTQPDSNVAFEKRARKLIQFVAGFQK
jgi:hypothetical protein